MEAFTWKPMWCKQLEFKQFCTTQVSCRNSSVCKEIECKYFCTLDLIIICIVSRNVWKMMLIWMVSLFIQENIITLVINLRDELINSRTQNNYNRDKDKYRETQTPGLASLVSSDQVSSTPALTTILVWGANYYIS